MEDVPRRNFLKNAFPKTVHKVKSYFNNSPEY